MKDKKHVYFLFSGEPENVKKCEFLRVSNMIGVFSTFAKAYAACKKDMDNMAEFLYEPGEVVPRLLKDKSVWRHGKKAPIGVVSDTCYYIWETDMDKTGEALFSESLLMDTLVYDAEIAFASKHSEAY